MSFCHFKILLYKFSNKIKVSNASALVQPNTMLTWGGGINKEKKL